MADRVDDVRLMPEPWPAWRRWTPAERLVLARFWSDMTVRELAGLLDRTPGAVRQRAQFERLGPRRAG